MMTPTFSLPLLQSKQRTRFPISGNCRIQGTTIFSSKTFHHNPLLPSILKTMAITLVDQEHQHSYKIVAQIPKWHVRYHHPNLLWAKPNIKDDWLECHFAKSLGY
jgi:hypothetical protein